MATKEQIKSVILAAAGNPKTGWIAENAANLADKIFSLDNAGAAEVASSPVGLDTEKRVTKPEEIR